ncbi:MAG: DUF393 domain-containing protein [Calditrichaeota bacterium]|nr:MAG: DUF393 domain-containing protein [Calditrichota bacterium]
MNNKIIIFDGVCNLCTSLVHFIIKRDKDKIFLLAPSQSDAGRKLIEKHRIIFDVQETMVLIDGESVYSKSTAVFLVLKDLHTFWKILYPFVLLPIGVNDFFYMLIAKSRYSIFGKKDRCMVPTEDIRSRFLN